MMSVLANALSVDNEVEIICLRSHQVFYSIKNNVKLTFADDYCGNSLFRKLVWLHRYVPRQSLVIAFMVPVYVFVLAALMLTRLRIVVSERNDPSAASLPRRFLRWLLLWRAQHVVMQTEHNLHKMPFYYPRSRMSVIFNPISDKYDCGSGLMPIEQKAKVMVTVGRLSPQKNQKMMIAAFRDFWQTHQDWRLEIYGDGEIHDEISNFIHDCHMDGKVVLKGRCETIHQVLPTARMFVMTSNYEGMSNAMIEALYVGIPVVTTAVSGTEELFTELMSFSGTECPGGIRVYRNGIVVGIGNQEAFTNAMGFLADNTRLITEMGKSATKIANQVSHDKIISDWNNVIYNVNQ